MTTNHITLPREQQLAEELGFWIEEVAGVWLHREPDDRDREATLSERVLWSELLAAHPVEGDVPDSFAARWLTNGASLHPLTVNLVVRFARALASKLSAAEKKYGYSDGWRDPNWMDECRQKLAEHIAKGDPRDVAAYCAFLWHHGESTTTAQQPEATEREASTLETLAQALNDVGHAFWKACRTEAGGGAVRWIDFSDDTLIIFTRGEYRDALLAAVDKIPGIPVLRFDNEDIAAIEHTDPTQAQAEPVAQFRKSLNAQAADLLRPFLKPGDKVIWREPFRWFDDSGVLSSHYDGMELESLAADFGYEFDWDTNFKHAAIVRATKGQKNA